MAHKRQKSPAEDLKVTAARHWQKTHHFKELHDVFEDDKFRKTFDSYINNPRYKTRRALGLENNSQREKRELHLLRTLKQFGETP